MPEQSVGARQGELELGPHLVVALALEGLEAPVQRLDGLLDEPRLEQDLGAVETRRRP